MYTTFAVGISIRCIHRIGTSGFTVYYVQLQEIMPAVYENSACSTFLLTLLSVFSHSGGCAF